MVAQGQEEDRVNEQDVWVFVSDSEAAELRIISRRFMVSVYDGRATVEDIDNSGWQYTLHCHRDPTMGWVELSCF